MVNTMISIPGYVHLYRSLLRFYDMPENEVREMLYLLNTANLDCYEYYHPDRSVIQSGPVAFCGWLETKDCRPYRTEVQLYKSLLFLKRSIDRDLIVSAQSRVSPGWKEPSAGKEYREGSGFHTFDFLGKKAAVGLCGDFWYEETMRSVL